VDDLEKETMKSLTESVVDLYKRGKYDLIPISIIGRKAGRTQFGFLSDKQLYALELLTDNKTTFVGYGGSARSGKTIIESFWETLQCLVYPEVRYGLGREELTRLRSKTMITYYALWKLWGLRPDIDYRSNNQTHTYKFKNGSEIILIETSFAPRDPDFLRFGGLELTAAAVDESNESTQKAIDTLFTRTGWQKNEEHAIPRKMLETFNPNKSHVYNRYWKPYRDKEETEKKKFIPALPSDNPHPSVKQWIEDVIAVGDTTLIERLIHGNFDYDDDPAGLCDFRAINDLFTNDHIQPGGHNYISADLAMQGRDRFIGGHWEGLVGYVDLDIQKIKAKGIEQKLTSLKIKHRVPNSRLVADSDGLGEYLESYIENIETFHNGSKAVDSLTYANIKAECAWKLAELINRREIKVVCSKDQEERIKTELSTCLKADKVDSDTDKKRLIPKKRMRELLGRSPDYMDFLIMRMIFEVKREFSVFVQGNYRTDIPQRYG